MKKTVIRICIAIVILIIVGLVLSMVFLGNIVKTAVETVGPRVTKTDVTLGSAQVTLWSGGAELKDFTIGNPSNYKSKVAMKVGDISVRLQPGSVFSDKLIVHNVTVKSPEITFEGGLSRNNLKDIENNVNDFTASPTNAPVPANQAAPASSPAQASRKLQIDELSITGVKVHLISSFAPGGQMDIGIPDVHLTSLGTGPDGITPADAAQKAFSEILKNVTKEVAGQLSKLGGQAVSTLKDAAKSGNVQKAGEKLKGLFGH